jgi:glycerophosphoryl diester phosphodiesterase
MRTIPLIVAHRGASRDAPENTIPAFELAWKQGADAIEADFHLSQDSEIVCIHDKTTKEVAWEERVVAHSTLNELRQLDVGIRFGRGWKGTTIPTIREVFTTIPKGKKIFLEIKSGSGILPKLYEELAASGLTNDQIVIISFDMEVIARVKQGAPAIQAMVLFDFKNDQPTGTLLPSAHDMLRAMEYTHADGVSTKAYELLDETFIQRIIKAGYEYHVWTIDSINVARKFQTMGVTSISTNVPGYLKDNLR